MRHCIYYVSGQLRKVFIWNDELQDEVMHSWYGEAPNPNLAVLFRSLFWGGGGGGGKTTPCLKLVRIMLETSNLARK